MTDTADRDAAPAAALCNPCREGTPKEGCKTCSALAALIGAVVEQYFPDADPTTVQVHMAGTPPWEREGWEDEADHRHAFTFLRQEKIIGERGNPSHDDDVFFCTGCLEHKRVEVWRGRASW